MTTINYDRDVADFIDELSDTGHVTHNRYKKKSVTLHHNGGVGFSHQGILNIWKSRPASAHFDSDAQGDIAQYVEAHEYAWAVGNTQGNCETISIEMANSSGSPTWEIGEATWKSAARLAGWLFAHVIDGRPRPSRNNLFFHHHWSSTSCAGPWAERHYDEILKVAQGWYDHFRSSKPGPVAGNTVVLIQRALETEDDGKWGKVTDRLANQMRDACRSHAGHPRNIPTQFDIMVVQRIIDTTPDGRWGPKSQAALVAWLRKFQRALGVRVTDRWDATTEARFRRVRNNHLIKT